MPLTAAVVMLMLLIMMMMLLMMLCPLSVGFVLSQQRHTHAAWHKKTKLGHPFSNFLLQRGEEEAKVACKPIVFDNDFTRP